MDSTRRLITAGIPLTLLGGCGTFRAALVPKPADPDQPLKVAAKSTAMGQAILANLIETQPDRTALVSPVSISSALALLGLGSAGQTRAAMAGIFDSRQSGLDLASIGRALKSEGDVVCQTAQSAWAARSTPFKRRFSDDARTLMGSEVQNVDFGASEGIRAINQWGSQATRGKVPSIIQGPDASLLFVLIATAYFKGLWREPFDPAATGVGDFTLANTQKVRVPMMRSSRDVLAYSRGSTAAIRLPFKDPRFEIILAHGSTDAQTRALASSLTQTLARDQFSPAKGDLVIPKLKLSFTDNIKNVCARSGFEPLLVPGADYSAMISGPVQIENVLHQATFDMDEQGAEAAAATSVMGFRSMEPGFAFVLNKPFVLALVERTSNACIMLGYVTDPGLRG
jgi:serine protease inhibitor